MFQLDEAGTRQKNLKSVYDFQGCPIPGSTKMSCLRRNWNSPSECLLDKIMVRFALTIYPCSLDLRAHSLFFKG